MIENISRKSEKKEKRREEKIYSAHPQTCFRKAAMFTFLFLMSSIQGCSSIRHGVALRDCSFSRLLVKCQLQP